ncbi:hypothetical protein ACFWTE_08765 [Nocardiopsis sp. NPDC058631]|uniref:hypothetical protein n=1 Tax=Nocardiopsis sp. NPDC058631 TaxID=3346566 RepID=UPI0036509D4E
MERARRALPTTTFSRWSSPLGRVKTDPEPCSGVNLAAPLAALRRQGWTVWFGRHTRQYWAAHTRLMRLVCADTPEELVRAGTATTGAPSTSPFRGFRRNCGL